MFMSQNNIKKYCILRDWLVCQPIKCQCCPFVESSQFMEFDQVAGFYMRETLALNGLTYFMPVISFYFTSRKQKARSFLIFLGVEIDH